MQIKQFLNEGKLKESAAKSENKSFSRESPSMKNEQKNEKENNNNPINNTNTNSGGFLSNLSNYVAK